MDDNLVEELRKGTMFGRYNMLMDEAADEIERLRGEMLKADKEIKRLRKSARDWAYACADPIEVKPRIKRTVWINVYEDGVHGLYGVNDAGALLCGKSRIACVKIEIDCEEGEGL